MIKQKLKLRSICKFVDLDVGDHFVQDGTIYIKTIIVSPVGDVGERYNAMSLDGWFTCLDDEDLVEEFYGTLTEDAQPCLVD